MSRIFIVEDELLIAEDLAQTLLGLGYEVAGMAQTGLAAVMDVEKLEPDLVLMDIKLAGRLDGIQATAALRKRAAVPVVYLTSHSDDATLARAKETGAHGYLIKPFNERELRTAIEVALSKHQLEQSVSERERWYSSTLSSVGDAVIATDRAERVTFMNTVAEQVTGFRKEDAYGKPLKEVFRLTKQTEVPARSGVDEAFRAEISSARLRDRSGAERTVDDTAAPIVDAQGQIVGSVVVFRDITERRRLEHRAIFAERLASIASMASSMAHELNNPLAAAFGNVEFASRLLTELRSSGSELPAWLSCKLEEASEALADARAAGTRVRRIVSDLKKFARTEELGREALDLPELLRAALSATQHRIEPGMTLSVRLGTTPSIEANQGQLVQVFVNLLENAAEFARVPNGHRIELSTHTDELGRGVVEVVDNGLGIPTDDLERVFEPFFTTKTSGNGLGVGLAIVQRVVTALGGQVTLESRPGVGSTFRVTLPPARELRREQSAAVSAPPAPRRARVLVIDDEEIVGRTIERLLVDKHDVTRETDPRKALARISAGERFDVVVCDLSMPHMNGMDVFEQVSALDAQLASRIVFLTGGAVSDRLEAFLDRSTNLVLNKPFSVDKLLAGIAGQLR